jgi:hypothetical protein
MHFFLVLFSLSLFFAIPPASSFPTETHRYFQRSGGDSHYFDWILVRQEETLLLRAVSPREEHRTLMEKDTSTLVWSLTNAQEDTAVEARREGNRIELKGLFRGKPIVKQIVIDEAPWFQSLSISLRSFLEMSKESTEFWIVRPDKLNAHKLRATKKGMEMLDLGQQRFAAQKIEVRLIGVASLFGRGNYWFRANDRLLLLYRGPGGLPGVPSTTITLDPVPLNG